MYSPYELLFVCELDIGYSVMCFLCRVMSTPSAAARRGGLHALWCGSESDIFGTWLATLFGVKAPCNQLGEEALQELGHVYKQRGGARGQE
jgi:hypothetical protein